MFAVNINLAVFYFDPFAGKGDDAFDEIAVEADGAAGGGRGGENDHVAALGRAEFISQFVGEEKFAVMKVGIHGAAVNLVGLGNQKIN